VYRNNRPSDITSAPSLLVLGQSAGIISIIPCFVVYIQT